MPQARTVGSHDAKWFRAPGGKQNCMQNKKRATCLEVAGLATDRNQADV